MTYAEALAELGIDADATSEEARRAYLRLLKARKPEEDRAGFMRLREAYEIVKQGNDGPAEQLLQPPQPVGETAELENDEEAPSLGRLFARAQARDRGGAAEELVRLYDAAAAGKAPLPSVHLAVDVLLHLHAEGKLREARALSRRLSAAEDVRALRGHVGTLWAIAKDLGSLPERFPQEARAAMARGALDVNVERAHADLDAFARGAPDGGTNAALALRAYAPTLTQLYAGALEKARPPAPSPKADRRFGAMGGVLVFFVVVMRAAMCDDAPPTNGPPSPPAQPSALLPRATPAAERRQRVEVRAARARVRLEHLARTGSLQDRDGLVGLTRFLDELSAAVERGDCARAPEIAHLLADAFTPGGGQRFRDEEARVAFRTLEHAVNELCKARSESP
jgi:hypothetical protein